MTAIVEHLAPGDVLPTHMHLAEDEIIFIHQGQGIELLGDNEHNVEAGSLLYIPSGTWHSLRNTSKDTKLIMLAVFSPPGMERFFRDFAVPAGREWQPPPTEKLAQMEREYSFRYLDPP
jgi:quercetin dioxygenase-like cupin family protein